jgi:hypothetical protein
VLVVSNLIVISMFTNIRITQLVGTVLVGFITLMALGWFFTAFASSVIEHPFKVTKSISDNIQPNPYTADQFKFHITGNGVNKIVNLTEYTVDTAEAIVYLPVGNYTLEEVGPTGFVADDWTLQWSGPGCETANDGNGPVRPIEITVVATDINYPLADDVGNACKADNQWRGEPAPILGCTDPDAENYNPAAEEDNGSCVYEEIPGCTDPLAENYNPAATVDNESCEYDNGGGGGSATGTIRVIKQVINDNGGTGTTSSFSFVINNGSATAFEADGSNNVVVATGTYSVTESAAPGYATTYSNCTNLVVTSGATLTCTITNNDIGGGGGDGDKPTYLVFGYVWHDVNENDAWEKEQPNPSDDESDLDDWTVQITDGVTTYATTTDANGYYYFYVPAGTWTINEVLQNDWSQTFPNNNTHVVVVLDEAVTLVDEGNFLAQVVEFIIPTAHAQTPTTYGPYDFGNVFRGGGDGGGGGGGGGGGSSSGGGGSRISLSDGNGSNNGTDPTPKVLGEATGVMPVGAPNTGAGGTAPVVVELPHLGAVFGRRTVITHGA